MNCTGTCTIHVFGVKEREKEWKEGEREKEEGERKKFEFLSVCLSVCLSLCLSVSLSDNCH